MEQFYEYALKQYKKDGVSLVNLRVEACIFFEKYSLDGPTLRLIMEQKGSHFLNVWIFFFFLVFCLFRAAPEAYGGFQARGLIGAVAFGLHHSHSNVGSKPCL